MINLKQKLLHYKKLFKSLLKVEFFNFPVDGQKRFITLVEEFLTDCKRINEEAKIITEKTFTIQIKKIVSSKSGYTITGLIGNKKISIKFPKTASIPEEGHQMVCILYSIDGTTWYSSKETLVKEAEWQDQNGI